jgi:hypothetical protein
MSMIERLAIVWLALALCSCVGKLRVDDAPCPCGDGYDCCQDEAQDQCVPRGQLQLCRISVDCPLPGDGQPPAFDIAIGQPGTSATTPYPSDDKVRLIYGPQNGFHVFLQFKMTRMDPTDVRVTRRVLDPNGVEIASSGTQHFPFTCDAGNWVLRQGGLTYICPSVSHQQVYDRDDLSLEVTLTDKEDRTLTHTEKIEFLCPDDENHALCLDSYTRGGCGP